MKPTFIPFFLFAALSLSALTLILQEKTYDISTEELQNYEQAEVETQREKDAQTKFDVWQGTLLSEVLAKYRIEDFTVLKFTSQDNYQVRLSKQDISAHQPILALQKNEILLSENEIRLIVPPIREMYWIKNIDTIEVEKLFSLPIPYTLLSAEQILPLLEIHADLPDFQDKKSYLFRDLLTRSFPDPQDEFWVVGRDGVSHRLDYDKYLKNAVLVIGDGRMDLQSNDMPNGMWIKNLVYIQAFDRAVFFRTQFKNWQEVAALLQWKNLPFMRDDAGNPISFEMNFSDPEWQNIRLLKWQDR